MTLRELPRGLPFILGDHLYFRDFMTTFGRVSLIKAYKYEKGRIDFQLPQWYDPDTEIIPYVRKEE